MKTILSWQIGIIIEHSNNWSTEYWKASLGSDRNDQDWKALSPFDWQRIFSSILLLRCEAAFYNSFGREILILEQKQRIFQAHSMCCSLPTCSSSLCTNPDHKPLLTSWSVSCGKEGYEEFFDNDCLANPLVQTLCELSDRANWGHVAWLFCQFKDKTSA